MYVSLITDFCRISSQRDDTARAVRYGRFALDQFLIVQLYSVEPSASAIRLKVGNFLHLKEPPFPIEFECQTNFLFSKAYLCFPNHENWESIHLFLFCCQRGIRLPAMSTSPFVLAGTPLFFFTVWMRSFAASVVLLSLLAGVSAGYEWMPSG